MPENVQALYLCATAAMPLLPTIRTLRSTLQAAGAHRALVQEVLEQGRAAAAQHVFTACFDEEALAAAQRAGRQSRWWR
jgi:hypothetical protein